MANAGTNLLLAGMACLASLAALGSMTPAGNLVPEAVSATSWTFATPEWIGTPEYGETLNMRKDLKGKLLFKHSKHPEIFEFSPVEGKFEKVPAGAWDQSVTPAVDCDKQPPPPPQALRKDEKTGKLIARDKSVPMEGLAVMGMAASPSGKWTAVLTVSKDPHAGLVPFLGGGLIRGSYYHRIYSTAHAEPFGPPIKIASPKLKDGRILSLRECWSADEQYVVYFDSLFSSLFITKTNIPTDSDEGVK